MCAMSNHSLTPRRESDRTPRGRSPLQDEAPRPHKGTAMAGTDRSSLSPRQREIIDCALEVVGEVGLAGLTTRRLAERVGFSEAALFRHFSNKQTLVLGLMDRLEDMLVQPMRAIAGDASLGSAGRLEAMVRHHTTLVLTYNSLPILLFAEAAASGDDVLLARMRSIAHAYLSLLEGVIREGQSSGELTPEPAPEGAALMLMGAPAALAIRHRLLPDRRTESLVEDNLIPFIVGALKAPGGDRT